MSEHITHLGIHDDVTRLANCHPTVHAYFREILAKHPGVSRTGAVTRSADRWTPQIIDWARAENKRPAAECDPQLEIKLAFVLGALTHRAADRLMKPILHYAESQEGPDGFFEATIHCDVFVFKELYGEGEGKQAGPFSRALSEPTNEAERRIRLRQIAPTFTSGSEGFPMRCKISQSWRGHCRRDCLSSPDPIRQSARP